MLNLTWIKNPDHVSYCKENEVLPRLARELGIADLAQQVEERLKDCKANLTVAVMGCAVNGLGEAREADIGIAGGDGCAILFQKGTTLKLFIPNLTFPEPVEMGENVWIYMGELCPAYCLFTPWETKEN